MNRPLLHLVTIALLLPGAALAQGDAQGPNPAASWGLCNAHAHNERGRAMGNVTDSWAFVWLADQASAANASVEDYCESVAHPRDVHRPADRGNASPAGDHGNASAAAGDHGNASANGDRGNGSAPAAHARGPSDRAIPGLCNAHAKNAEGRANGNVTDSWAFIWLADKASDSNASVEAYCESVPHPGDAHRADHDAAPGSQADGHRPEGNATAAGDHRPDDS